MNTQLQSTVPAGAGAPDRAGAAWWRHGMVWLVIAGPVAVMLAGVATAVLAWRGADGEVAAPAAARPALEVSRHLASGGAK